MSDSGTGCDCTICVTNNGDIASVVKDLIYRIPLFSLVRSGRSY